MATRTISTKLVVDGEAEYKKAITDCNSQLSVLKSSLAATESEFRNNANSLEALTAKDEKLNELKEVQAAKIKKLKEAFENCRDAVAQYTEQQWALQDQVEASDKAVSALDAATQKAGKQWAEYAQEVKKGEKALAALRNGTGDTSAEQAKLEASISKAREEMGKLESATDGAAKEAGELLTENQKLRASLSSNEASLDAATRGANNWEKQLNSAQIEANKLDDALAKNNQYLDEAAASADGCAKSIDQYGKEIPPAEKDTKSFADTLKNGLAAGAKATAAALAAVGTAAVAGVKMLNDLAESTEEYRAAQGKLNTAFEAAGYSTDTAKEAYQTLYSILGDTDNATESAQLLAQLAKSEEDISSWGDIAAGVMGTFGDALPINSLIEASNETAKVGQVTGTLADALNWVGISEDEFNEKLAACADTSERTALITDTLSETYQNASDIFRENNATLMEANKAQAEMDDTLARLGGTVAEVKSGLTAEFMPSIAAVADAFIGLAEGADGAEEAFAAALDELIGKAAEKLPELLEFGTEIILNLLSGITNAAPQLAEGVATVVTSLTEGIIAALPQLAEAAAQLMTGLVEGIAGAAPELIPAATEAVTQFVQALVDNIPLLADAALELVTGLADGVLEAVPVLLEALPELIESLVTELLEAVPEITETGVELLSALVDDLPTIIDTIVEVLPEIIDSVVATLLDHLPELVDAGVDLLTALVEDLPEIIQTVTDALPELVVSIVKTLLDHVPDIVETGVELLTALITDLPHIIAELLLGVADILTGMEDALNEGIAEFENIGKNLVRGLWTGIQSLAGWLWDKVSGWITSIWDGITDFFGIASPSKQMAWVGEMLVEGLAGAVSTNGKKAVDAVGKMSSDMLSEVASESSKINGALAESANAAIEGLVLGAEGVKDRLATAYADAAGAAGGMAVELPPVEGAAEFVWVEPDKDAFAQTIAEMETDFRAKMGELVTDLNDAITEMNMADAAYAAGVNNMLGLISGTKSQRQELVDQYAQLGRDALATYKREVCQASPSKKLQEAGGYDIQGIIQGAGSQRAALEAAYADAARAALDSMERNLPSTLQEPRTASREEQTAAILSAVGNREGGPVYQFYIDEMNIRDDSDIDRLAQRLYTMAQRESRSRGGGTL